MARGSSTGRNRIQRNVREKHRRMQMKHLLDRLAPLIHPQPSKLSVPEVVDQATVYVKQLSKRVEQLRKGQLKPPCNDAKSRKPAVINLKTSDSILEVNLVCGVIKNFMSHEIISVLEEEGAEVLSYTYYSVGESVMYTIISQAINVRIGMEISRIHDRLKELVY